MNVLTLSFQHIQFDYIDLISFISVSTTSINYILFSLSSSSPTLQPRLDGGLSFGHPATLMMLILPFSSFIFTSYFCLHSSHLPLRRLLDLFWDKNYVDTILTDLDFRGHSSTPAAFHSSHTYINHFRLSNITYLSSYNHFLSLCRFLPFITFSNYRLVQ